MKTDKIDQSQVDFSRGDKDIVFITTSVDMKKISEEKNPKKELMNKMEEKGLKTQNTKVLGIFNGEFSLLLEEDAKMSLNGDQIYPKQ